MFGWSILCLADLLLHFIYKDNYTKCKSSVEYKHKYINRMLFSYFIRIQCLNLWLSESTFKIKYNDILRVCTDTHSPFLHTAVYMHAHQCTSNWNLARIT